VFKQSHFPLGRAGIPKVFTGASPSKWKVFILNKKAIPTYQGWLIIIYT
jgi:hypothetical protein